MFENPDLRGEHQEVVTSEGPAENPPTSSYRKLAELICDLDAFETTNAFVTDGLHLIDLMSSFSRLKIESDPSSTQVEHALWSILRDIEDELSGGPRHCPPGMEHVYEDNIYPTARRLINSFLEYYHVPHNNLYDSDPDVRLTT